MPDVTREQIVAEARSWIPTAYGHQQRIKHLAVDCDNFVSEVARACGVELSESWDNDYSHVEDGSRMLALLEANLIFVSDSLDDALPADIIVLSDEKLRQPHAPRHMGFLTEWQREDVPYFIHASERGVREHRLDTRFKMRVHSVWRIKEIAGGVTRDDGAEKLQQLKDALKAGEVRDPFSGTIFAGWLIGSIISTGVSIGTALLTRAFAPKPKPIERGRMTGELIINSEQGVMIPEVYGGDPGDGKGGCRIAPQIIWTSGIRKTINTTRQPVGGGKGGGKTQEVREITYDIDLALQWCRGPALNKKIIANVDVIYEQEGTTTGIFDPGVNPDDPFDDLFPPDPQDDYDRPLLRHGAALTVGAQNVRTGITAHGGYSPVALYPGNLTQLQDPIIQAAVDALLGANSTPAYRRRNYTVHGNFSLSRFGNAVPNYTGILEHETLKTLSAIYGEFCTRVGLSGTDYDFTALAGVDVRGLLISGRRYQPSEVIEGTARIYNAYVAEIDGKITGKLQGAASGGTIDDSELGWLEGDADEEGPLPELDTTLANEISLPRRVDVKFFDPDKDFEQNDQGDSRQITTGEDEQTLDVQLTLTAEEAREIATRELYQEYVEGTRHRFTLPWTYLYLNPGDLITIPRDEGFTHVVRLTSIRGGIGVLECEAQAVESAVFTQSSIPDGGTGFEQPPVPIPAMSIVALLDVPLLRDIDNTTNNGIGFYACATPRTGVDQVWQGASLYVFKVSDYERVADFPLSATMGRQVLANGSGVALPAVTDWTVFDNTNTVTVDLYGTEKTLESLAEIDVLNGGNACLVGSEVIQFRTATRVGGQPNRWTLSGLLRARRGTESSVSAHVLNERFILLDSAVQFVPLNLQDLNVQRTYKCVSVGQSLDDGASVLFTWIGEGLKPLSPARVEGHRNAANDLLIRSVLRSRIGQGLRDLSGPPLGEEREIVIYEIMSGATVKRTFRVIDPIPVPSVWRVTEALPDPVAFTVTSAGGVEVSDGTYGDGSGSAEMPVPLPDDFFIEAVVNSTVTLPTIGIVPAHVQLNNSKYSVAVGADLKFYIRGREGTSNPNHFVRAENLAGAEVSTAPGDRISIRVRSGVVDYFKNYTNELSKPFYTSAKVFNPAEPQKIVAQGNTTLLTLNGFAIADSVRVSLPRAVWYTAAMQAEDGFTPGDLITVRAYQESALVGRSQYREAVI